MKAQFKMSVNPRVLTMDQAFRMQSAEMKTVRDWIDTAFTKDMARLYATEGRSGGEPWRPLSPRYARAKAKRYPGRKILSRTGALRKSLANKNAAGHIAFYTHGRGASVTVGTAVITALYHAPAIHGNPFRPNPRLPVRDPMQTTEAQNRGYLQAVLDYFVNVKFPRVRRTLKAGESVMRPVR